MDLFNTITNKAKICNSKQKQYRRLRLSTKKEKEYAIALALQKELLNIPKPLEKQFEELYKDAFSRISMARVNKKKEIFNGKVVHTQSSIYVGPSLSRLVDYVGELYNFQPSDNLIQVLKHLKKNATVKVDGAFCDGMFQFQTPTFETESLLLQDLRTINISKIKNLKHAIEDEEEFINTLASEPWIRCSRLTGKYLWFKMIKLLVRYWEGQMYISLKGKIYLGKRKTEPYYSFRLEGEEKTHTSSTKHEAILVAEVMGKAIEEIKLIDPKKSRAVEIKTERGEKVEYWFDFEGAWVKEYGAHLPDNIF